MGAKHPTIKASILSTVFALVLAAMVFAPCWFVFAFLSRLITGRIHLVTYLLAGAGAVWFFGFSFRMIFEYLREGFSRQVSG